MKVCHINVLGTVCDDFGLELADAQVACRQLGLLTTGATRLTVSAVPEVYWLTNITCGVTGSCVFNCNVRPSEINCYTSKLAEVNCRDRKS